MKIGLINIEPKIVNTAYMQISQYHKQRGDSVEWCDGRDYRLYDDIYCSSIFDFTPKGKIPHTAIFGGTGFGVHNKLPQEIEACDYDYSLYPECDYSILWFSRGCIRNCPFCLVPKKEGKIHPVDPKALNAKGKYIVINDNNFFACPTWERSIPLLKEWGKKVVLQQGIDIRIIQDNHCAFLQKYHWKQSHKVQIKFAWDNPNDDLLPYIQKILRYIQPHHLSCYVLIGYWSTPNQDLYRVETLRELGIDPFVMPYVKSDPYQRNFARWVNMKAVFKSTSWEDYRKTRPIV